MSYENDVFISYSHEDVAWARMLEADLRKLGVRTWRDETRLDAGKKWRKELQKNLRESQHLAIIWSNLANQSNWVQSEITQFDTIAGDAADRKLLFLVLEGSNDVYSETQMLLQLRKNNAYANPNPQNLPDDLKKIWQAEVDGLFRGIKSNVVRMSIPCAIIAMTEAELAKMKGTEDIAQRVCSLDATLQHLKLGTLADLKEKQRYGPSRLDWRPFCGATSIQTLLDGLISQINMLPKVGPTFEFAWEFIDFLNMDVDRAQAAVRRLTGEVALVVLDPLSLYEPVIRDRALFLKDYFDQDNVMVMTLMPFDLPTEQHDLRQLVRSALAPLFDFYLDPPVPLDRRMPLCGLNLGDVHDMRRIVQFRVGNHTRIRPAPESHPVTTIGRSGP